MAIFDAYFAIDYRNIDLNFYDQFFVDDTLLTDAFFPFDGTTYRDVYSVVANDGFVELALLLGGNNFAPMTLDGTVKLLAEYDLTGGGEELIYSVTDFSISYETIFNAAITASNADDLSIMEQIFSGNDELFMSDFDDFMTGFDGADYIVGYAGGDTLYGGNGADEIEGNGGADKLVGEAGWDSLYGGNGWDTIFGGDGNDYLDGGVGNDLVYGGTGGDLIYTCDGDDTIYGGAGDDKIFAEAQQDTIEGGGGDDTVNGGDGKDRIVLGSGSDKGVGGKGWDKMFGNKGNDILFGNDGNDLLNGGGWADTLNGGAGDDTMTGGGGADRFEFKEGFDTITDYEANKDVLILDLSLFGASLDLADYANDTGADIILTFNASDVLTLEGVDDVGDITWLPL